jgi:hypothetical protein
MSGKIYEINGGFPPIKYCKKTKENTERSFASTVNIKNILYRKSNDKIIDLNQNEDNIETIDSL